MIIPDLLPEAVDHRNARQDFREAMAPRLVSGARKDLCYKEADVDIEFGAFLLLDLLGIMFAETALLSSVPDNLAATAGLAVLTMTAGYFGIRAIFGRAADKLSSLAERARGLAVVEEE